MSKDGVLYIVYMISFTARVTQNRWDRTDIVRFFVT
jgi:hypothetical protein